MAAHRHEALSSIVAFSAFLIVVPVMPLSGTGSIGSQFIAGNEAAILASDNYTYHSYTEIRSELLTIEAMHPDISKVYDIGDSWEKTRGIADRDVLAIKISDNVTVDEDEPEVLVTALQHAREWTTTEIAAALAERLTDSYGTDPQVSWLVDNREVWIIPIVNPDGLDYSLSVDDMWRKNRHLNVDLTYGVDLNRNYGGSSNGDPLGEWGGAGSSRYPGSEVYCGVSPFSEPETQAISQLVRTRNFTLALDFHSYGNQVLWPWGYTTNRTPAYDDLSRIGSELAAINGYTSEQSIGLYPTTGDMLDWTYGFADIYPFTFEVGDEFHPMNATTVGPIISINTDAAIRGIEIAGDRMERGFNISHSPVPGRVYSPLGFNITANVTADRGVDNASLKLVYSTDSTSWTTVPMCRAGGNDTYWAIIPPQTAGTRLKYYFIARDFGGAIRMSPGYAPYDAYSFVVLPDIVVGAVTFSIPRLIDGSRSWSIEAAASNWSEAPDLTLMLHPLPSPGVSVPHPMLRVNATSYRLSFSAGMAAVNYSAHLIASIGGVPRFNSSSVEFEIADLTPPTISEVTSRLVENATDPGRFAEVRVSGYDVYEALQIRVIYRLDNGQWLTSEYRPPQGSETLSHTFEIPVSDKGGVFEFRVEMSDARNIACFPVDSATLGFSYERVGGSYALQIALVGALASATVAVICTVYLFTRARRQRASGPSDSPVLPRRPPP